MAADFASEYGIRLISPGLCWREFSTLLTGLLAANTRLFRHYSAKSEEGQ